MGVGHSLDPPALLSLAKRAFGRAPEAWWITIPTLDYTFGVELSPVAERGVADALRTIGSLLGLRNSTLEATLS
jgi:hydrogenase maturation protease